MQTLPRYSIGYTTYLILFKLFILLLSLSTRQRQELRYSRPAAVCGCFATHSPRRLVRLPSASQDHAPAHLGHGCPKWRAWHSVSHCAHAIAYKTGGKQIHASNWRIISG